MRLKRSSLYVSNSLKYTRETSRTNRVHVELPEIFFVFHTRQYVFYPLHELVCFNVAIYCKGQKRRKKKTILRTSVYACLLGKNGQFIPTNILYTMAIFAIICWSSQQTQFASTYIIYILSMKSSFLITQYLVNFTKKKTVIII